MAKTTRGSLARATSTTSTTSATSSITITTKSIIEIESSRLTIDAIYAKSSAI